MRVFLDCRYWRMGCGALVTLILLAGQRPALEAQTLTARLVADIQRGKLQDFDFVKAAFIAGGVTDERELLQCHRSYLEKRKEVLENCRGQQSAGVLLAELHRAMHQKVLLGRYQAGATDLRIV